MSQTGRKGRGEGERGKRVKGENGKRGTEQMGKLGNETAKEKISNFFLSPFPRFPLFVPERAYLPIADRLLVVKVESGNPS
jgi:hypothetical protein